MTKKALQKNVDPSVVAFVSVIEKDTLASIQELKLEILEHKKQASELKSDLLRVQKSSDSTDNSIAAVELKAKRLVDKALGNRDTEDSVWKDDAQEVIDAIEARVSVFEKRMDAMEANLKRYFDKEKYAITKAMIAQVISEEKANG